MKKTIKIFFILFLLFITAENISAIDLFAGGVDPHDSLLFDGGNISDDYLLDDETCFVWVWGPKVKGRVIGFVERDTIELVECGTWDTVKRYDKKQLPNNGYVFLESGKELETGPDGYVDFAVGYARETFFGLESQIDHYKIGPNTKVFPDCRLQKEIVIERGKLWRKQSGKKGEEIGKESTIESPRTIIKPTGTEYSVEVTDIEDIIRVYEGSVSIYKKELKDNITQDYEKEVMRLTNDLMAGKISQDEYQRKVSELAGGLTVIKTIEAGQQCSVSDKMGEVVPITDDDKWWSK